MPSLVESNALTGRRILVVEDEYLIADDMVRALEKLGAEVVGPVPTKQKALALLASDAPIDAAILDINLQGEAVFPVAEVLMERGVPFVFATGYDKAVVPAPYDSVRVWEKLFNPAELAQALPRLLQPA